MFAQQGLDADYGTGEYGFYLNTITSPADPALTLGCGAVGGSSSADNISPMHLLNVRRMAYGAREREDVTGGSAAVSPVSASTAAAPAGEEELMQAVLARVLQRMNLN